MCNNKCAVYLKSNHHFLFACGITEPAVKPSEVSAHPINTNMKEICNCIDTCLSLIRDSVFNWMLDGQHSLIGLKVFIPCGDVVEKHPE